MFISNGIVYASERPENVQIIAVKPLDDMMMLLTFQLVSRDFLMLQY